MCVFLGEPRVVQGLLSGVYSNWLPVKWRLLSGVKGMVLQTGL